AGVARKKRGAIAVDEYSKTNVEHIHAIGDVTDRLQLTPVAIHEAMAFVNTVFAGKPTPVDHELIATAVFTTPEKGHSIDVYKSTFRPLKNTLSGRNERSVMKVIVDQKTDKVLGCHLFSPHA